MSKHNVDWNEFNQLIEKLAGQIEKGKYSSLYGIPRGGVPVALALSIKLQLPLLASIENREFTENILIVDDVADTGATLERYKNYDTAVLHVKPRSKVKPTYVAEEVDEWIVYPWEITETGQDEGLEDNIRRLLEFVGEDPNREGLLETPKRVEKAWQFWTKGYKEDPAKIMKVFENPSNHGKHIDQLILVPNIDFYSMCEHHLAPFYGTITIGYIPNDKVLGVSKFARLSEIYSRRLQIQERLGQQIADDVMKYLDPQGVGVIIRGIHLCMRSRGVEKQNTEMVTSIMLGVFRDKMEAREEFLQLIK